MLIATIDKMEDGTVYFSSIGGTTGSITPIPEKYDVLCVGDIVDIEELQQEG